MKSTLLLLALPFVLLASCTKEKAVGPNDLPATSTSYITAHFPDQTIVHAVKEFSDLQITYTVYLKNGVKIEFNQNGEVTEIEGSNALPDGVIPSALLHYVNNNYASEFIKEWKQERTKQKVKLSNGIELEFDKNGNFLRVNN